MALTATHLIGVSVGLSTLQTYYMWALSTRYMMVLNPQPLAELEIEDRPEADYVFITDLNKTRADEDNIQFMDQMSSSDIMTGFVAGFCFSWPIANYFGRKGGLLRINGILLAAILIQGIVTFKTKSTTHLTLSRGGLGGYAGASYGLYMMYLFEVSPITCRGSIVTFYFVCLRLSGCIMEHVGTLSGPLFFAEMSNVTAFILLGVALILTCGHTAVLHFGCPESPGFVAIQRADIHKGEIELKRLLSRNENVTETMQNIILERQLPTSTTLLFPLKLPLFVTVVSWVYFPRLIIGNENFYLGAHLGLSSYSMMSLNHILAIITILTTFAVIDRLGRKVIFVVATGIMISVGGMASFYVPTTVFANVMGGIKIDGAIGILLLIASWIERNLQTVCTLVASLILMELAGQKSRAKMLVLPRILELAVLVVINVVIAILVLATLFVFGLPSKMAKVFIKYVTLIGPMLSFVFLGLLWYIWKRLPETKGKRVEVRQQVGPPPHDEI